MRISEIFLSIAGETSYAGMPCVFVRVAGCNLNCEWCDTVYAKVEGRKISVDEVIQRIRDYNVGLVCITGGEPLLQDDVYELMDRIVQHRWLCLLETNGSIPLAKVPAGVVKVMDVKTPSSGMGHTTLLENLNYLTSSDEVKFVVADYRDYIYARDIVEKFSLGSRCCVLFSPAYGRLDIALLANWILEDRLGVRLQLQLHRIIWPNCEGR